MQKFNFLARNGAYAGDVGAPQAEELWEALSLPEIPPEHVKVFNAFYTPRPGLKATFGGKQLLIAPAWPHGGAGEDSQPRRAVFQIGDSHGELLLPGRALELLLSELGDDVFPERLAPEHLAMAVEFVLSPALEALEPVFGAPIAVTSVSSADGPSQASNWPALFFRLEGEGVGASWCELRLSPEHAVMLAEYLDRRLGTVGAEVEIPVPARLRVGAVTLTLAEMKSLACGDILMADSVCEGGSRAVAVVAGRFVALAERGADGVRFMSGLRRGAGSAWEWSLDQAPEEAGPEASGLESLPVHMVFEIGRGEVGLSELRRLGTGSVAPFAPPSNASFALVANGRRVGAGVPVRIGAGFGVRITSLTGWEHI